MDEFNISKESTVLEEFAEVTPKKGKLFEAFIIASLFFTFFVLVDLAVDFKKKAFKPFDWQLATLLLILPVFGIMFHLSCKKIGWVINSFYYFLIASMVVGSLVKAFCEGRNPIEQTNWRGFLILLLTFTCAGILLSAPIRKLFRVNNLLLYFILIIPIGLAAILTLTVL